MADIHTLSGAKVQPENAGGVREVVAQLEWMLDKARKGEIEAFAVVMREPDGIGTTVRGQWRGGFFEALGALTLLQIDMSNGSREDG